MHLKRLTLLVLIALFSSNAFADHMIRSQPVDARSVQVDARQWLKSRFVVIRVNGQVWDELADPKMSSMKDLRKLVKNHRKALNQAAAESRKIVLVKDCSKKVISGIELGEEVCFLPSRTGKNLQLFEQMPGTQTKTRTVAAVRKYKKVSFIKLTKRRR